jgi:uncharacterized protein YcbK (DUF882 family)
LFNRLFEQGNAMVNSFIKTRYTRSALLAALLSLISPEASQALDGKTGGLNGRLMVMLRQIENHFGRPLTVNSGCRSHTHNRRIGGARRSYHLRCMAADVKVKGVSKWAVLRYAMNHPQRGGVGSYCRDNNIHVDVGPRRAWNWRCGGGRKAKNRNKMRRMAKSR